MIMKRKADSRQPCGIPGYMREEKEEHFFKFKPSIHQ